MAKRLGVTAKTWHTWLRDPQFAAELQRARQAWAAKIAEERYVPARERVAALADEVDAIRDMVASGGLAPTDRSALSRTLGAHLEQIADEVRPAVGVEVTVSLAQTVGAAVAQMTGEQLACWDRVLSDVTLAPIHEQVTAVLAGSLEAARAERTPIPSEAIPSEAEPTDALVVEVASTTAQA